MHCVLAPENPPFTLANHTYVLAPGGPQSVALQMASVGPVMPQDLGGGGGGPFWAFAIEAIIGNSRTTASEEATRLNAADMEDPFAARSQRSGVSSLRRVTERDDERLSFHGTRVRRRA